MEFASESTIDVDLEDDGGQCGEDHCPHLSPAGPVTFVISELVKYAYHGELHDIDPNEEMVESSAIEETACVVWDSDHIDEIIAPREEEIPIA